MGAFQESAGKAFAESLTRARRATRPVSGCGVINVRSLFPHHGWFSASAFWSGTKRWDYGGPGTDPDEAFPMGPFDMAAIASLAGLDGYLGRPPLEDAAGGWHTGGTDCTAGENRWLSLTYEFNALYTWDDDVKDLVITATKSKYTGALLTLLITVDGGTVREYELDEASGDVIIDATYDVISGHPFAHSDFFMPGIPEVGGQPGSWCQLEMGTSTAGYTAFESLRGPGGTNYSGRITLSGAWTMDDAHDEAERMSLLVTLPPSGSDTYTINGVPNCRLKVGVEILVQWIGGQGGVPLELVMQSDQYTDTEGRTPGALVYFGWFGKQYLPNYIGTSAAWSLERCYVLTNRLPTCLRAWAAEYCFWLIETFEAAPFSLTTTRYEARWVVEPGTEIACVQEGFDCVRRFTTTETAIVLEPDDLTFAFGQAQLELACSARAGSACCYGPEETLSESYTTPYPEGHSCTGQP